MHIRTVVAAALLASLPWLAGADELKSEPHALIYYQVSFFGPAAQHEPRFGLRLDRATFNQRDGIDFRGLLERPALMHVQFTPGGMQQLSLAGTDYLKLYRAQNAAEGEASGGGTAKPAEAPAKEEKTISKMLDEANPGFLIGGAVLVAVLATSWGQ